MNVIQKGILKKLFLNKDSTYSDLKKKKTPGNKFVYHLNKLLKDGLVKKIDSKYKLTNKGKLYFSSISMKNFSIRSQPKIVNLIILENKKKYLFCLKKNQPFLNQYGFILGKLHFNEGLKNAAERELFESTGLLSKKMHHCGFAYINIYENNSLISSIFANIFYAKDYKENLLKYAKKNELM
jgi:hypothetical protein